ncbi:hypothetical protein [Vibrio parahaemolyticus]|uniref:hypothetical protein n=1 Tax=Vibrio parahaemolyticus TaxID=670 RepID=UPI0038928C0A|nr:hypothetical protein [Vibrio parahaemolyticus]
MKTSARRKMYSKLIIKNHQSELEQTFEEQFDVVSYILAGSIVVAEHEYDFQANDSVIPELVSNAVRHLTIQDYYSPTCYQMPLVLRALRIYCKNTVPALRGYQTLCTCDAIKAPKTPETSFEKAEVRPLASLLAKVNQYALKCLFIMALAMIAAGVMFL